MIRLAFILFFIVSCKSLYAQSDKAQLKIAYQMVISSKKSDQSGDDSRRVYNYSLLCNSEKSVYADSALKDFYKVLRKNRIQQQTPDLSRDIYPKSKSSVYKDRQNLIATLPIGSNLYTFPEPNLKWEVIPNEKKNILGNTCFKAKTLTDTGKLYYAWYCPEISIPDGPFRFKGLAGLVLEVHNEDSTLMIEAVKIEKSDEIIEPIAYAGAIDLNDKSTFLKKRSEFIENPNSERFSSPYKAYTLDGKEIKADRRKSLKINESILLD